MTHEESEKIRLKSNEWPKDKWGQKLYLQSEVVSPILIEQALKAFINIHSTTFFYLLFYNYDFGMVKLNNELLFEFWKDLLAADGDEIFVYPPDGNYFICIEKTEEVISGREIEGRKWIYEITFSNIELKNKILDRIQLLH